MDLELLLKRILHSAIEAGHGQACAQALQGQQMARMAINNYYLIDVDLEVLLAGAPSAEPD